MKLPTLSRFMLARNAKPRAPECSCRPACPLYCCNACQAWVPWCFGAADDMPGVCDRCWVRFDFEEAS